LNRASPGVGARAAAPARDTALSHLVEQILRAGAEHRALCIRGGGTKDFYGEAPQGHPLDVRPLHGIVAYEPSELVVTVRAGTPLRELEAALAQQGQCLPFEPPRFGAASTVGGMVASGLAGPSRAAVGGVRDYVLGATMINGRGEVLTFGGQVMKNVAGYDVSRVLAGSMGILGVISEVSLKVLPTPRATATLRFEAEQADALPAMHRAVAAAMPVHASAWCNGTVMLRLAGARAAVDAAVKALGGDRVDDATARTFWDGMRDQRDAFFAAAGQMVREGSTLWRLSVPATTAPLELEGPTLIEWGGSLRWLVSRVPLATMRHMVDGVGGHATVYHSRERLRGVFAPLPEPVARIHRDLKRAFDPHGIFNPGRLVPQL
jgi:glycolate oxidase FAD binding subunit